MHGLEYASCLIEEWRWEAQHAPTMKCLMESIDRLFPFDGIGTKTKFQQNDRRDESNDRAMPADHPLGVHADSQEIDEDVGIEQNLADYR